MRDVRRRGDAEHRRHVVLLQNDGAVRRADELRDPDRVEAVAALFAVKNAYLHLRDVDRLRAGAGVHVGELLLRTRVLCKKRGARLERDGWDALDLLRDRDMDVEDGHLRRELAVERAGCDRSVAFRRQDRAAR